MLGLCSGCEDYFEVQRQFDLELKKLEVAKLELEIEKLKLQNQHYSTTGSVSTVVVKNPTDKTSVNLDLELKAGRNDERRRELFRRRFPLKKEIEPE